MKPSCVKMKVVHISLKRTLALSTCIHVVIKVERLSYLEASNCWSATEKKKCCSIFHSYFTSCFILFVSSTQ